MQFVNNELMGLGRCGDVSIEKLSAICDAVKEFGLKTYPGYSVGILSMDTDSDYDNNDRINLMLIFNKIEGNVIEDSRMQWVFYIKGDLLTCEQYREQRKAMHS